jgi:hypothetical protein
MITSSLEFYRNPSIPLGFPMGGPSSWAGDKRGGWNYPGTALSASSIRWFGLEDPDRLEYARWVLVWNPNNPSGGVYVGARLVLADSGPANLDQIGMISANAGNSPVVGSCDITAFLKAAADKQIIQQTQGDSIARGPLIYASSIDLKWRE